MIQADAGTDLISAIRHAARAIVFVSVPWSDEARDARNMFVGASRLLQSSNPDLQIAFFQLNVHHDEIAQRWVTEQGFPELIEMGAGNVLWMQSGHVVATESSVVALGVDGVVAQTLSLWSPKKRVFLRPTRVENFISKASAICNVCIDATCVGIVIVLSSLQFFAATEEDKVIPFGVTAFVCIPIAFCAMVYAWGSRRGFGVIAALLLFCWAAFTFVEFVYMGLRGFAG